jgi:hypothetical protein
MYVMARDSDWKVEQVIRMRGISLRVTDPRTGMVATAFAHSEEQAWNALADSYNWSILESEPFWRQPSD